jgi:hypothetical protein
MILALDHYFVHRGRTIDGKGGNPLNEVWMLRDGLMEHEGRMSASRDSLPAGNLDPETWGWR